MIPKLLVTSLFLAFNLVNPFAHADSVPKLINYQGKLTDAGGEALNGEYELEFRLYDAATEGTLVWGEKRTVMVVNGVFNVALGGVGAQAVAGAAVNDIGFAFGDAERYLETRIVDGPGIEAEQILSPRQQMVSVPFALTALDGVPVGTVVPYFGVRAPSGWLFCAGQALPREGTYERLFAVVGTSCGAPDEDSFNVPDLRGRFLRGVDDPDGSGGDFLAAGLDPDAASRLQMNPGGNLGSGDHGIGTVQGDATKFPNRPFVTDKSGAHRHPTDILSRGSSGSTGARYGTDRNPGGNQQHGELVHGRFNDSLAPLRRTGDSGAHDHKISGGDKESRPINAACNFSIKY